MASGVLTGLIIDNVNNATTSVTRLLAVAFAVGLELPRSTFDFFKLIAEDVNARGSKLIIRSDPIETLKSLLSTISKPFKYAAMLTGFLNHKDQTYKNNNVEMNPIIAGANIFGAKTLTLMVITDDLSKYWLIPTSVDESWIIKGDKAYRAKYGTLNTIDSQGPVYPSEKLFPVADVPQTSGGGGGGSPWQSVPGGLKHVSVGADGTVWGVNKNDQIYRRDGGNWRNIPGGLKQISVGSRSKVWGVNRNDQIYYWNGSNWTNVPGGLKYVSAASDGSVWGVNKHDQIYRRDGNKWTRIQGALKQVSVGRNGKVWGVNSSNHIYRWNGGSGTGNTWTRIQGSLKHVSVAADGTVWGVNSKDEIYKWVGRKRYRE